MKNGLAKPEIFAMGMRNDYTINIDPKTDEITTAWVGPDQGTDSTTWGEAKTENATMMNSAGYYGWPFCQAGNRWGYRAKLGGRHRRRRANLSDNIPARSAAAPMARRARSSTAASRSPTPRRTTRAFTTLPLAKPVNIWYGPQGGCYNYPKNANGVGIYTNSNTTASPGDLRLSRGSSTGNQAPMDGGIYRRPANAGSTAWPSYWDGRWFLMDFANAD